MIEYMTEILKSAYLLQVTHNCNEIDYLNIVIKFDCCIHRKDKMLSIFKLLRSKLIETKYVNIIIIMQIY